jgi:DNA-binding NarL/FixJ family response regulator
LPGGIIFPQKEGKVEGQPISIVLVDNHKIIREGLKSLLDNRKDIEVAGIIDYKGLPQLLITVKPAVILLSILSSCDPEIDLAIKAINKQSPDTELLILGYSANDGYLLQYLRMGAMGCLLSDSSVQDLITSIYELASGGAFLPSPIGKNLIQKMTKNEGEEGKQIISVSPQQLKVLKLICRGFTNREIADMMFISRRTVDMHVYRLYKQLNVTNRAQAIQFSINNGIINTNDFGVDRS